MFLNRPATDTQVTHLQSLWLCLLAAVILNYLVVPCLIIVPMSFSDSRFLKVPPEAWSLRWYESFLTSAEWRAAIRVSLRAAVFPTIIATPIGVAAA
ncbi:MAG: ABC transporter permease [Salipiger thiooxidans]|uniref:ABC transporter permease n=1 Tax=Salipiger thiooxidans TaxID=282683 RepID=UPI001CFA4B96|nr:hypothetical protein [Salipiger thiooxidans]